MRDIFQRSPRVTFLTVLIVLLYLGIVVWAIVRDGWSAVFIIAGAAAINFAVAGMLKWAIKGDEKS